MNVIPYLSIDVCKRGSDVLTLNYPWMPSVAWFSPKYITYDWTDILILDRSYLVENLTNSKIAETKA